MSADGLVESNSGSDCEEAASRREHDERETSRLELYSDAVFSILATISILPAMEALKESDEEVNAVDLLLIMATYFITFLLIIHSYNRHVHAFNRLYKLSAFLMIMNTIYMVGTKERGG